MKKIVLGCATILLSLGLLAGCNNEDDIIEPGPVENPDGGETSPVSFGTDSWETINKVCAEGLASTYYDIGDTKTITINNSSYVIRIIDFDHDELTTADKNYNDGEHAAITCEMVSCLSKYHSMNSTSTNVGGWDQCEMRSYLNTEVFPTLDSDLQSVIKKVDKKTTAGGQSIEIVTSSDSLFLLARVEVDIITADGYKDEGTQYEFYSELGRSIWDTNLSKSRSGLLSGWWLRSPVTYYDSQFECVDFYGGTDYKEPDSMLGVSFAFCI